MKPTYELVHSLQAGDQRIIKTGSLVYLLRDVLEKWTGLSWLRLNHNLPWRQGIAMNSQWQIWIWRLLLIPKPPFLEFSGRWGRWIHPPITYSLICARRQKKISRHHFTFHALRTCNASMFFKHPQLPIGWPHDLGGSLRSKAQYSAPGRCINISRCIININLLGNNDILFLLASWVWSSCSELAGSSWSGWRGGAITLENHGVGLFWCLQAVPLYHYQSAIRPEVNMKTLPKLAA